MPYQVTEPHPTALPNQYIHTGRGGAGNMFKVKSKATKSPSLAKVPSSTSSIQNTSAKTSTGRGGAGNIHAIADLPHFSFEDEMTAQAVREKNHSIWHVGRGGAGNWTRKGAAEGSRKSSNESAESRSSTRSGFFSRNSDV